nr:hypothetical protein [Halosimplex carlsbadense]
MVKINVIEESIPSELRPIEQWICWREGERDGKPTKIPTKPYRTSGSPNLDVTDPSQRRDFETAWKSLNDSRVDADGLGFVFTEDVSITGVDLDKCRDPDTGALEEWADEIVERLDSYTEVSPSGTGVHILVGGELPPGGNRKGRVEMYDTDRYFTVTGAHVDGTPTEIQKCQEELAAVHREYIQGGVDSDGQLSLDASTDTDASKSGEEGHRETESSVRESSTDLRERYPDGLSSVEEPAVREAIERVAAKYLPRELPKTFDDLAGPGVDLSNKEIRKRMFDSKGGDRKRRLYEGDASMWGSPKADYPSQSEADMALAHNLAFWTGKDPSQMDSLFRESGLYREKWDRKHYGSGATYGEVTLARALLRVSDYYELPSRNGGSHTSGSPARTPSAGDDREDPPPPFEGTPTSPAHVPKADSCDSATRNGSDPVSRKSGRSSATPQRAQDCAGGEGMDQKGKAPSDESTAVERAAASQDGIVDGERPPASDDARGRSASTKPASPSGIDTDGELNESTQRAMEETAAKAGSEWERTNPDLCDCEKHPNDWTVPRAGRSPSEQALDLAREDNRVLARRLRRESQRLEDYHELEAERERFEFTAEVYLRAIDELMGERNRYRTQLRRAGLLTREDQRLHDDPVKHLKQILRPMVRRKDTATAKETLTGLDAVLQEYEETNERIQANEREKRGGVRETISRLFG